MTSDARDSLLQDGSDVTRSLPDRVVVGANGAYWRDYGTHYSICPVSNDNDPLEIAAVYERVVPGLASLLDALEADERHGNLSGRTEDAWYEFKRAGESESTTRIGAPPSDAAARYHGAVMRALNPGGVIPGD
jgi:hypothetical protein